MPFRVKKWHGLRATPYLYTMFRKQHLIWWACLYLFWVMIFQKRSFALSTTATIEFCYLLFIAANFYYNSHYIVPRFLYKQKYLEYILLFIAGIIVTASLRVPLAAFLNSRNFFPGQPQPSLSAIFIASGVNIFVWTAMLVAAYIAIDRYNLQQYTISIEREKAQAELDFLNAQLNPHFLFNSLNSIYGHIDKQNAIARNMLLTFSEMLRYQLYISNKNLIDIEDEIEYLKNYVAMQHMRKNEGLTVTFNVTPEARGFYVAPLLFIAFVENAFKYVALNDKKENRIDIAFQKEDDTLQFRCYNSKDENNVPDLKHKGIGIENTKRRLKLHYRDKHQLKITNENSFYEVNLQLQLA